MDPTDFFLYDEFLNPGMKYECQGCGTLFGDESVVWDEETKCNLAACPGCGNQVVMGEERDE